MTTMTFADTLRQYRTRADLSLCRLADLSPVDRSTISRWESGDRYPTRDNVEAIAATLRLDASDTDRLLASAGFLPSDLASAALADEPVLVDALQMIRDGSPAQQAHIRRALADALATADGMTGGAR